MLSYVVGDANVSCLLREDIFWASNEKIIRVFEWETTMPIYVEVINSAKS